MQSEELLQKAYTSLRNSCILKEINEYFMKKFEYKRPPAHFGISHSTINLYDEKVRLYLRMVDISGGLWPANTLVLVTLGFPKPRKGHNINLLDFLSEIAYNYKFDFVGAECISTKDSKFITEYNFSPYQGTNGIIPTNQLYEFFNENQEFCGTNNLLLL